MAAMTKELPLKPIFRFRGLSEQDVLIALDDHTSMNPITLEVNRLIECYTYVYEENPEDILQFVPRWPIEAIALRLAKLYPHKE